MTREHFENNTNWKMSYEEFQKCDCTQCNNKDCIHRDAFRRVPVIDGGLCLCPKQKECEEYQKISGIHEIINK